MVAGSISIPESLTEYSLAKRASDNRRLHEYLDQIREWDRAELDPQEQISYDMSLQVFETFASYEKFDWLGAGGDLLPGEPDRRHPYRATEFHAVPAQGFERADRATTVSRLRAIGNKIDAVERDIARQASLGVVPPDFIIDKTLSGLSSFLGKTPEQNALVAAFAIRLAKLTDVEAAEQTQLKADALAAVRDVIYPPTGASWCGYRNCARRPRMTRASGG